MPTSPGPDRTNGPIPDTVTVSADRAWLSASWPDGRRSRLAASDLRNACRCAYCVRARAEGTALVSKDVRIVAVEAHGPHVGRLTFSDGHDRGLYPWADLLAFVPPNDAPTGAKPTEATP